jgi:hypothetical protein
MNGMRVSSLVTAFLVGLSAAAQQPSSDAALLAKTRVLYDAPFARGLISFDCAVQFDWKQHFVDAQHFINPSRSVAPQAVSAAERLQTVTHRVFMDRSGAVVSAVPVSPDFAGIAHADDLERVFRVMVKGGLDTWMPFATNVILPMGSTKYEFEKMEAGYKVAMNGDDLSATLVLNPGLGIVSGSALRPQAYQFKTGFTSGPDGYLLESISTGSSPDGWATFDYSYQTVQGIQLPLEITVKPATSEAWRYSLSGCKAMKGIVVNVGPPKH